MEHNTLLWGLNCQASSHKTAAAVGAQQSAVAVAAAEHWECMYSGGSLCHPDAHCCGLW